MGRVDDATAGATGETESEAAAGDTGPGTGDTAEGFGEPGTRAGCRCTASTLASSSGDAPDAATPSFIEAVFATSDTTFIIGAPQLTQ
jgi:hypothetical protein